MELSVGCRVLHWPKYISLILASKNWAVCVVLSLHLLLSSLFIKSWCMCMCMWVYVSFTMVWSRPRDAVTSQYLPRIISYSGNLTSHSFAVKRWDNRWLTPCSHSLLGEQRAQIKKRLFPNSLSSAMESNPVLLSCEGRVLATTLQSFLCVLKNIYLILITWMWCTYVV